MEKLLGVLLISLLLFALGYFLGKENSTFYNGILSGIGKIKIVKRFFDICGILTLIGGIISSIINSLFLFYVFMTIPLSIACLYTIYQYCKSYKHLGLYITIIIIWLVLLMPIILYMPQVSGDNRIFIKSDTLFINGPYSRVIPKSEIASLQKVSSIPNIKLRTNGIAWGNIRIGHFRTENNKDISLYLNSSSADFYFIHTIHDEYIYINFMDKRKRIVFSK